MFGQYVAGVIDASERGRRRMNLRRREASPISASSCRTLRAVMSTKSQLLDLLGQGERAGCVARHELHALTLSSCRRRIAQDFAVGGSKSC